MTRPNGLAYQKAIELMQACATEDGFLASPTERSNYRRIWARDGVIMALAALMTEDPDLTDTARRTLERLAEHQGPHGEIPSNLDAATGRVSYGGTTGRVDANPWFVIGCAEYWHRTGDTAFIDRLRPAIERVRFLLGAWEFNNRGLLYVPVTGDWADEYVHSGYVLYDQLLYLQAQRAVAALHAEVVGSRDHGLLDAVSRLSHLIRANYWFNCADEIPPDAYHEVLYRKGLEAAPHCGNRYWMPSFSPSGYGYRFDGFANVLVSLLDVADDDQRARVDDFISAELVRDELPLLPAFHPVIEPVHEDWEELQVMFSYTFKNKPYEFHNGGLWPMLTGFYVVDLARRGRTSEAERFLDGIDRANALTIDDEPWGFPEFVHGRDLTPGGTRHQGWSAAASIMGHLALRGQPLFTIDSGLLGR